MEEDTKKRAEVQFKADRRRTLICLRAFELLTLQALDFPSNSARLAVNYEQMVVKQSTNC
jgi:hypothetical protein